MSSLAVQILDRVPKGGTIDRAQLAIDANYDSISRVLRRLVDDGKLVRVRRGRYRRASGKRTVSNATIADNIAARIARSKRNVFLRTDFANFGSYDAVGRAMRRLVDRGCLLQIGYGLYAKAGRSPFTGKSGAADRHKTVGNRGLEAAGKSASASTLEVSYNSGRSTQVPTGRVLKVKDRVRRRIGYDGKYVVLERA